MQIFAKRTKKKVAGPRTVNKSDPIVEELLKKDQSEWNAKERRMVKRYRERKATESDKTTEKASTSETENTAEENIETEDPKEGTEQEEKEVENVVENDGSDGSSSSSEDEVESDKEDEKENYSDGGSSSDKTEDSTKAKVQQSTIENEEKINTPEDGDNNGAEDDGKVGKDNEIWSVLDKLNSKQKRTLSRKLDRLGKAVLDEVEEEANKILDMTLPIAAEVVDSKRDLADSNQTPPASEQPKKKKRKKAVDWSSLTPEERLRREDQRKKQQEVAELKARGEYIKPGHKRPLNSARRRANRRKPKWDRKAPSDRPDISGYKQEHHSSGFNHRKNRHAPQETMNE